MDILPFLLLPLAGPEELTEEENDGERELLMLTISLNIIISYRPLTEVDVMFRSSCGPAVPPRGQEEGRGP